MINKTIVDNLSNKYRSYYKLDDYLIMIYPINVVININNKKFLVFNTFNHNGNY